MAGIPAVPEDGYQINQKEGTFVSKKISQTAPCPCGSGEQYGSCCGREELCECGSGKPAGVCCYFAE
ncbi:MAG: hypothetical protein C7B43_11595 [Sulfobacillus benefaciens]|uniref:Uncharacterized protein n=1 Tax=Sulfobacillus benefaciens TaxID=453960 RepID=A0A2T2WZC1_9FIRM|nr:MAG: hypothetical protein C7B43_11595 [Sulfobacillus benefaciens]